MSRFLKRIGTTSMKFQFDLKVEKLIFSIPMTHALGVKWTRGPRTATLPEIAGKKGVYEWVEAEDLTLISTLYQETKSKRFQKKKSKITVFQKYQGATKAVGYVDLDLSEYAGALPKTANIEVKLQKCSDRKARLLLTISSRWLKELGSKSDDTASAISGLSGLSMESEQSTMDLDIANMSDFDDMKIEEEPEEPEAIARAEEDMHRKLVQQQNVAKDNAKLTQENASLKKEIQDLKQSQVDLEAKLSKANQQVELHNKDLLQSLEGKEAKDDDIKGLERKLASITAERDSMKEELVQFASLRHLQKQWQRTLDDKDADIEELKKALQETDAFKAQIKELEASTKNHDSALLEAQERARCQQDRHVKELKTIQEELAQARQEVQKHSQAADTAHVEMQTVRQDLEAAHRAESEARRTLSETETLFRESEALVDSLKNEIAALQVELNSKDSVNDKLQTALDSLQNSTHENETPNDARAVQQLHAQLDVARARQHDLEARVAQLTAEKQQLQKSTNKEKSVDQEYESIIRNLRTDNSQLRDDLRKAMEGRRQLQQKLIKSSGIGSNRGGKMEDLRDSVQTERTLRIAAEARASEALRKQQELTTKLNEAHSTHDAAVEKQRRTYEEKIHKLQSTIQEERETYDSSTDKQQHLISSIKTELQKTRATNRVTVSSLREDLQSAQQLKTDLQSAIEGLQAEKDEILKDKEELVMKHKHELHKLEFQVEELELQLKEEKEKAQVADRQATSFQRQVSLDSQSIVVSATYEDITLKGPDVAQLRRDVRELEEKWNRLRGNSVYIDQAGEIVYSLEGDIRHVEAHEIHNQYEGKIQFLNAELSNLEETLSSAKTAWEQTNKILFEQVREMENNLKREVVKTKLAQDEVEQHRVSSAKMKASVKKAQTKVEKMSQYMNSCEVQLVQKKIELVNTVDALNNMEYENTLLKSLLQSYKDGDVDAAILDNFDAEKSAEALVEYAKLHAPEMSKAGQYDPNTQVDSETEDKRP